MFNLSSFIQAAAPPKGAPIDASNYTVNDSDVLKSNKYKSMIQINHFDDATNQTTIDNILETEKQHNKADAWNRLDKTVKTAKLHDYAEKYGRENTLPVKDIKSLKQFFSESLSKNKLQKTKEVLYDKEKQVITGIPSLFFNTLNRSYTLRIMDAKRVSTLKSLTPKRVIKSEEINAVPSAL
jgi:hypothetical protein